MGIIEIITLIGGVAFFLYGMTVMSNGLEKMSGGKLEATLKKMTSNVFKSLALGAGITIAMQSSSAMTVMLVGLVNSGIMNLKQTVGLIMGSNIGTTLTAFLTSLIGVESSGDGFNVMDLMKPANFSLMFALVGVLFVKNFACVYLHKYCRLWWHASCYDASSNCVRCVSPTIY